jgi:hypothetical protein
VVICIRNIREDIATNPPIHTRATTRLHCLSRLFTLPSKLSWPWKFLCPIQWGRSDGCLLWLAYMIFHFCTFRKLLFGNQSACCIRNVRPDYRIRKSYVQKDHREWQSIFNLPTLGELPTEWNWASILSYTTSGSRTVSPVNTESWVITKHCSFEVCFN